MISRIILAVLVFGNASLAALMIAIITDLSLPQRKRYMAMRLMTVFLLFEIIALAYLVLS